jgi:hypothetical protein
MSNDGSGDAEQLRLLIELQQSEAEQQVNSMMTQINGCNDAIAAFVNDPRFNEKVQVLEDDLQALLTKREVITDTFKAKRVEIETIFQEGYTRLQDLKKLADNGSQRARELIHEQHALAQKRQAGINETLVQERQKIEAWAVEFHAKITGVAAITKEETQAIIADQGAALLAQHQEVLASIAEDEQKRKNWVAYAKAMDKDLDNALAQQEKEMQARVHRIASGVKMVVVRGYAILSQLLSIAGITIDPIMNAVIHLAFSAAEQFLVLSSAHATSMNYIGAALAITSATMSIAGAIQSQQERNQMQAEMSALKSEQARAISMGFSVSTLGA